MSYEDLLNIDNIAEDLTALVVTGLNALEEDELNNSILIHRLFDSSSEEDDKTTTSGYIMATPSFSEAFLGAGNNPRTEDWTDLEIAKKAKTYPKESRETLKTSDFKSYLRMIERCQKGITSKFALLEPLDQDAGLERLKKSYNVMTRRDELKKEIEDADMDDVFNIPLEYDDNGIPSSSKFINLLETSHMS